MKPFQALFICTALLLTTACAAAPNNQTIAPQSSAAAQSSPAIDASATQPASTPVASAVPTQASNPPAAQAIDPPAYVDDNCQPTRASDESWQVVYQKSFTTQGQSYVLMAAKYIDGGTNLCVARSNMTQFQLVQSRDIRGAYIDRIVSDPSREAIFEIMIHEGNGMNVPIAQYRLDLSNPSQPTTQFLSRTQSDGSDDPQSVDRQIEFPAGAVSTTVTGTIGNNHNIHYTLAAQAGQTMTLRLTSPDNRPNATPDVVFNVLADSDPNFACASSRGCELQSWTGQLPATGKYYINLSRPAISDHAPYQSETPYSLEVTIR